MQKEPATSTQVASDQVPLCVDLDGTLVATDTLWESLLLLARHRPLDLVRLPLWVAGGRANLKHQLAGRITPPPASLPYRAEVLEFLQAERAMGRPIWLTTAADERVAEPIAEYVGLFDVVLASDGTDNCKGVGKLERIWDRVGEAGAFDYAGDARADLPLWREARRAIVVAPSAGVRRSAEAACTPYRVFERSPTPRWRSWLKAIRLHQGAKNVLLFVPLVVGHELGSERKMLAAMIAFVAMGCVASSVYITNDLLDLASDRAHKRKRRRPFASGALPIPQGLFATVALAVGGLALGLLSGGLPVAGMLLLYAALSTSYSFYLKRKGLVDVIMLASLYTHRILTGAVATHIVPTTWLLAFSMFLFLSLAFAKRYTEVAAMAESSPTAARLAGRGYLSGDLDIIRTFGPTCGLFAVLVLCLYINDPTVLVHYAHPQVLYLACPILLYWIMRIWLLAQRRQLDEDPVVFALRDGRSYIMGGLAAVVILAATIGHLPNH